MLYRIIPDLRPFGPRWGYEESEDFITTYNAAPATNGQLICNYTWRVVLTGAAAAVTAVETGEDSLHHGICQIETGTTATGAAGISRNTGTAVKNRVLGAGQYFYEEWGLILPALSTAAQEYSFRCGLGIGANALGTDFVGIEYDRTQSVNWRLFARASSSSEYASNGTNVAVSAATWTRVGWLWDGVNLSGFVGDTFIGSVAASFVPTATVGEVAQMVASVGASTKIARLDYMYNRFNWTTPRIA